MELKNTIDRWNKRWPGERDSRDRVWGVWEWGGGVGRGGDEKVEEVEIVDSKL